MHAPLLRFSTAAVEARLRPQLVGDLMARELAGGVVGPREEGELWCDWQLAPIAPGTLIGLAEQGSFAARREAAQLRDGDDDVSIFFCRRGEGRFDQNDRRTPIAPGDAVVVAHARPVASFWPDNSVLVVRLPRAAFAGGRRVDDAGGLRLPASALSRLLAAQVDACWSLAQQGAVPSIAARHLAELAAAAVDEALGGAAPASPGAVAAARFATMREIMARHLADPALTMAAVARAAGVSERTGYLVFAAAETGFSELLTALRLDRARELLVGGRAGRIVDLALAVGFSDLSHFNRRFRARFGIAPNDARPPR